MATLICKVTGLAAPSPYDVATYDGIATYENVGPGSPVMWTAYAPFGSTDAQIGAACIAAAVAAMAGISITVAPGDPKILIGGAVDPNVGINVAAAAVAAATAQTTANNAATSATAANTAATTAQATANSAATTASSAQTTAAAASTAAAAAASTASAAQATASSAAAAAAVAAQQPAAGSTVSLALNTARQPNASRGTRVSVCGTWAWNLTAIGSQAGTCVLQSDSSATPTTQRGSAPFTRSVGVGVVVADSGTLPWFMAYDVPAGHYYRIATGGAGTYAITHINETTL